MLQKVIFCLSFKIEISVKAISHLHAALIYLNKQDFDYAAGQKWISEPLEDLCTAEASVRETFPVKMLRLMNSSASLR